MAIVRAVKTGNWSDTTVWNTGALPTSADDVYSNTFYVTIDTSPTVLSISNETATGVTAGGGFSASANGLTLTCTGAGLVGGTGVLFTYGGTAGNTFNIVGNVLCGNNSSPIGARNNSTGTLNITGNVTAGSGSNPYGAQNVSTGTINITGNVTGSGTASGYGAFNSSTGTINIIGTCTAGTNASAGAAYNNSTGTLSITGPVVATATTPAIGTGNVGQVTILSGPLLSTDASAGGAAASGVNPCVALRWFPADNALSTFEYRMRGQTASGSPSARPARQLFLPDAYSATYPTAANVRSGTTYGPGSIYTGTCAVPAAASVLFGVPVDNTTGTVTITAADIRSALGLSAANLDTQLSGINTAATNAPTNVPPAVRTNLTAELARLSNAATTSEVSDIVTAAV